MRRTAHCLALAPLVAATALLAGCEENPGRGLIVENPSVPERPFFFDFGRLRHGTRTEHVLHLRNTDPETVTILSADPACACTRARAVRLLREDGPAVEGDLKSRTGILNVPPGELVEFVIALNTSSIRPNNDKLAVMRMRTTSKNTPFLTFEMHVLPEKLFTATPGEIRMGEIPEGHGGSGTTNIMTGVPASAARILDVFEAPGAVTAQVDATVVNGEPIWTVTATFPPLLPLGPQHETIVLSTTDADGAGDEGRLEIQIWANVVPDVLVLPRNLHFGPLREGDGGTLRAAVRALVPGARIRVLDVEVDGPVADSIEVEVAAEGYVDADGRSDRWALVLTSDSGIAKGRFDGTLRITTDDEQTPEVLAEFQGYVR